MSQYLELLRYVVGKALSGELTCMGKGLEIPVISTVHNIAWKVDNERMRAIKLFTATGGYEL